MKRIILPFVLLCIGLLSTSCIHDDPSVGDPSCDRYIDVRSLDGDDSQVKDVVIYVYNSAGKLLGVHRTDVATPINIEIYRLHGVIRVVVWGNTQGNLAAHTLSAPVIGGSINDHLLSQNATAGSFGGLTLTHQPSDIFYNAMDINFAELRAATAPRVSATVPVERVISSHILTINGLGKAYDEPSGDYKVLIRHPYSGLDFAGNLVGGQSVYMAQTSYDHTQDALTSSIGFALPTGSESLIIDVYSGETLLYTTTVDNLGNPISLAPRKLHNILIDMNRTVVEIVVSKWGQVVIFEGFN